MKDRSRYGLAIDDRIPALLPADASGSAELKIAHKTGEFPNVRHEPG